MEARRAENSGRFLLEGGAGCEPIFLCTGEHSHILSAHFGQRHSLAWLACKQLRLRQHGINMFDLSLQARDLGFGRRDAPTQWRERDALVRGRATHVYAPDGGFRGAAFGVIFPLAVGASSIKISLRQDKIAVIVEVAIERSSLPIRNKAGADPRRRRADGDHGQRESRRRDRH